MVEKVLKGTKREIAEAIADYPDDIEEVIVRSPEPVIADNPAAAWDELFAEMLPYTVRVGSIDYSREAMYTRMVGE